MSDSSPERFEYWPGNWWHPDSLIGQPDLSEEAEKVISAQVDDFPDLDDVILTRNSKEVWRLELLLVGPEDTVYKGGLFHFRIGIPHDYPQNPPKVVFSCPEEDRMKALFVKCLTIEGQVMMKMLGTLGCSWTAETGIVDVTRELRAQIFREESVFNERQLALGDDYVAMCFGHQRLLQFQQLELEEKHYLMQKLIFITIHQTVAFTMEMLLRNRARHSPKLERLAFAAFNTHYDYYLEALSDLGFANLQLFACPILYDTTHLRERLTSLRNILRAPKRKQAAQVSSVAHMRKAMPLRAKQQPTLAKVQRVADAAWRQLDCANSAGAFYLLHCCEQMLAECVKALKNAKDKADYEEVRGDVQGLQVQLAKTWDLNGLGWCGGGGGGFGGYLCFFRQRAGYVRDVATDVRVVGGFWVDFWRVCVCLVSILPAFNAKGLVCFLLRCCFVPKYSGNLLY